MRTLYITGGRQRELLIKNQEEQNLYERALICLLDAQTGFVEVVVDYKSPLEVRASATSSCLFKSGSVAGDVLYTCTSTEVLIYRLPSMKRIGYVSLPCFNDLHHVAPSRDGNLLAVSTGLDMVFKFDHQGRTLDEWCVLQDVPWSRFSKGVDYRKVESTKPHASHPNFVFELGRDVWVTRCNQRDAVNLTRRGSRIDIGLERTHDGLLFNDRLYFTTVDGRVVIANPDTLRVEEKMDLNSIENSPALLGWCRGLLPVDESKIWIGFTRVRKTRLRENLLWVRKRFKDGVPEKPTHIALYDLFERRCLREIDLERYGVNVIFGIFAADTSAAWQEAPIAANWTAHRGNRLPGA